MGMGRRGSLGHAIVKMTSEDHEVYGTVARALHGEGEQQHGKSMGKVT